MNPFRPVEVLDGFRVQVYSCPKCKARKRRTFPVITQGRTGERVPFGDPQIHAEPCECGAVLDSLNHNPAKGIFGVSWAWLSWRDRGDGGHRCDARCLHAKGATCECSCGGKNHGAKAVG